MIKTNIVRFAYQDSKQHVVEVILKKDSDQIVIQIIDDGIPFNPLEHEAGPRTDPAASLDGGMGLTLIKTFANSISYTRKNNQNQLQIVKKIKSNNLDS